MSRYPQLTMMITIITLSACSFGVFAGSPVTVIRIQSHAQTEANKRYEKDGLIFDYGAKWELSDQSNGAAQQLVLTEKSLDAQIMIVALRTPITNPKQEEQAKAALIEPGIARLLNQYESAGIKVTRVPIKTDLAGTAVEGVQLQFDVDSSPGRTDICWGVIGRRLVQLFFIRPEKTAAQTTLCWDQIRASFRIVN
jgi:hypothetical protein